MVFGIIALVTASHSKRLEDAQHKSQISGLEAANQKLVGELNLAERQLQVLTEAQEPWRMSLEKMNKFREELKSSLPKGKVRLEYIQSDERRARPFAEQIGDLLTESGYDVWGYMGPFTRVNAPTLVGIDMSVKIQKAQPIAVGLQNAFKAIGLNAPIKFRGPQDATYEDDQTVIYVGLKP